MSLQPLNTYGYYTPAFFYISINTEENLTNLNEIDPKTLATFYHEYIHFLQDIYTLAGLRNISYMVNIVYNIGKVLKKSNCKTPVVLDETNISELKDLFQIYQGTTFLSAVHIEIIEIDYNIYPCQIPNYDKIEYVDISVKYFDGNTDSFFLGSYIIQESMAYMMEYSIFGYSNTPIFPYKIVDALIDLKFNELNLSMELKVALCEESLNAAHPGMAMLELLQRIKQKRLIFKTAKDLHDFCNRNYFHQDDKGIKMSLETAMRVELAKCRHNLKLYFPYEKIKVNNWVEYIFNEVTKLRDGSFHLSNLVSKKERAIDVINRIGTPLVANSNNSYYFTNPSIDQKECHISLFHAVEELFNISLGYRNKCKIISYCLIYYNGLADDKCKSKPLAPNTRGTNCILNFLLEIWGIRK